MWTGIEGNSELAQLAQRQCGVATREQLGTLGVHRSVVRNHLTARRWTLIGDQVLLMHNSTPSRRSQMWIAVLGASPYAALCSHTALELAGFVAFATEARDIHLLVPQGAKTLTLPTVVVHESRRPARHTWVWTDGLPRTPNARSAIDAAAWQPWPRFACLMLAASVQQRVCTPTELDDAMRTVGRVRHKAHLRLALADVAGGSESLGEIDVVRLCRRFGIQPPARQVRRPDPHGGWRYLDCEWDLADGQVLVLEVDGRHHMDVTQWEADLRRERGVVVSRRWVLRATAIEVRLEPQSVVDDLLAMGVPRLVRT